ncbi:MAG: hypothetical protein IPQ19_07890 [Bacteroidetes bacterium]|nr:hypothetical protein [Bacteroidota bacterium]
MQDVFGIIDEKEKFYNDCVIEVSNRIVIEILNSKTIEQIQDVLEIADALKLIIKNY